MEIIKKLHDDPNFYVRAMFGVRPTEQQEEALRLVARRGAHIAIRSGHGTGKSAFLSWVILWMLTTRTQVVVPCTAPSAHQLFDVLWQELRRWLSRMPTHIELEGGTQVLMGAALEMTNDRLFVRGRTYDYAVARTARVENPDALQGFHAENVCYVIDEASGVPEEVFQVAEGALTGSGSRAVLAGNPTRLDGYFYDLFNRQGMGSGWHLLHWSSVDSPLVDGGYAERLAQRYGVGSNVYRVRVLGEFPTAEADQFIPLEVVLRCVGRDMPEGSPVVWGLDPAYTGADETVLCARHGMVVKWVYTVRDMDTMQVVNWVINRYHDTRSAERPEVIVVDMNGFGAGVFDRLRELRYPVMGVRLGERPSSKEVYKNLRAELWGLLKGLLESRAISLPDDDDLVAQISALKYLITDKGVIQLEKKSDLRRRLGVSPDRADALVLTLAYRPDERGYYGFGMVQDGASLRVINTWEVL